MSDEKCNTCHKTKSTTGVTLKRCGKCQTTMYCSTTCQRADWKTHKPLCVASSSTPSLPENIQLSADGQRITYNGHAIAMSVFQKWVPALVRDASKILTDELLFTGPEILSAVSIGDLKDDRTIHRRGYSFLTEPDNTAILKRSYTDPLKNLEAQPGGNLMINYPDISVDSLEELEHLDRRSMSKKFTHLAAAAYQASVKKFLELLLVVVLMCGGLPPYRDDLLHVLVINGSSEELRGVYIIDKRMAIITSNVHPTNPQPVVRSLPDQAAALIVLYLQNVRPLTKESKSGFLFAADKHQGPWSHAKYEAVVQRETKRGLGVAMGVEGVKGFILEISKMTAPGTFDAEGYSTIKVVAKG